jgi:hypothetical protein
MLKKKKKKKKKKNNNNNIKLILCARALGLMMDTI